MTIGDLQSIIRNNILERLASGEVATCMSVRLVRGAEIAQIVSTAGFDGFYIDLEHSTLGLNHVGQICASALGIGIAALVRTPENDPSLIARVLDAGAMGVVVPHIHSARSAQEAVKAAKFAPLGSRSVSPTLPQLRYRNWPAAAARQALNMTTCVVAMIESAKGVEHADEIAAVDGIDVLLVGTNDLCADLGIHGEFEHPQVEEAYRCVMEACSRHGKHTGIGGLANHPSLREHFIKLGARFVMAGSDLQFLMKAATECARESRVSL